MRAILMAILLQASIHGSSEIRAAFDIGTGKIKMQIAKIDEQQIESLYCQSEQISLSNVSILNQDGLITEEGQEGIVTILKSLKSLGESYGSTKYEAIATELFRKALNGQEIATKISALLGIDIKVVSPEEEGILSFLTIIQEARLDPKDIVVLDIGSGSFQITCKNEDEFIVYSAPFGRLPTRELVKNNQLSNLEIAISSIDPRIAKKIIDCKGNVIGIGAHPKCILTLKTSYDKNDLKAALQASSETDLNYSDLLLIKTIMEALSIIQVKYMGGRAGNTTGVFVLQSQ